MVLDHVLTCRDTTWLGTEREKLAHFSVTTPVPRQELPSVTFGEEPKTTVRYFVDRLPIGVAADGRTHVFLYLVTDPVPVEFRVFSAPACRAAARRAALDDSPPGAASSQRCHDVLSAGVSRRTGSPLRPVVVDALQWYFRH
jgi:hypothetical protein